jgi:hypothetical protein
MGICRNSCNPAVLAVRFCLHQGLPQNPDNMVRLSLSAVRYLVPA